MRGRLLWEVLWPWLYYEFIAAVVYLLYGWYFGELEISLIAMIAALVTLFPVYLYREKKRRDTSECRMQCRAPWLFLAVTAASVSLFLNLVLIFSGAMGRSGGHEAVNEVLYSAPLWLQLLVMGLAAPLAEELIYRGLAYRRLRTVTGIVPAAVVTALFFALFHGNLLQGVYTGILGLFLALSCETGGLKAAVWFHICANLTSLGMTFLTASCPALASAQWFQMGLLFAGGVGTFFGGLYFWRVIRRSGE